MKVKLMQGNNLQNLEREINKFIEDVKVESIDLKIQDKNYIVVITYYDKI
jgi:hypothetical protein